MDIYCTQCGEPWDTDSLHDINASDYTTKRRMFRRLGCGAFEANPTKCNAAPIRDPAALGAAAALADILGDDIDGLAVELEDSGLF